MYERICRVTRYRQFRVVSWADGSISPFAMILTAFSGWARKNCRSRPFSSVKPLHVRPLVRSYEDMHSDL